MKFDFLNQLNLGIHWIEKARGRNERIAIDRGAALRLLQGAKDEIQKLQAENEQLKGQP